MTSMREEANHASLSSQQKRELKWLITDKLMSYQAEAKKVAKTLANKRSGGAKRPRADTSISPPVPQPYRKGTKNERGGSRSWPRGPRHTLPETKKVTQTRTRSRPSQRQRKLLHKQRHRTHTHRYYKHPHIKCNPFLNLPLH